MKTNFPMQPSRRRAVKTLASLVALSTVSVFLLGCSPDKPQFKSIDLTGADYAQGFSLTDHNGQLRTLKDFAGKVVVVFFGFTQCPDVCPTSMAELAQVKQQLGADGDKLQAIFITVDPERDTADMLKAYMGNFDPTFLALRPTLEQLPQVAKDFKIYYKKVDGFGQGNRQMPVARSSVGGQHLFHFLHRRHFNLANPFGTDLVFSRQIMQRHAA